MNALPPDAVKSCFGSGKRRPRQICNLIRTRAKVRRAGFDWVATTGWAASVVLRKSDGGTTVVAVGWEGATAAAFAERKNAQQNGARQSNYSVSKIGKQDSSPS
jgi:hypothetical protein